MVGLAVLTLNPRRMYVLEMPLLIGIFLILSSFAVSLTLKAHLSNNLRPAETSPEFGGPSRGYRIQRDGRTGRAGLAKRADLR